MKTRILISFMMAALFVSSTALAQRPEQKAQRMDRKAMMNRQEMRNDFGQKLGLTDEQKEAMKKIRLETAKEVKPLKNKLRELQAHQQTLVTANNTDMKAIYKTLIKYRM